MVLVLLLVVPSKTAKLNVDTRPMPTPGPGVGRVVAARGPRDDAVAAAAAAPVSWQVATKWPHRENNARSWREAPVSPLEDG